MIIKIYVNESILEQGEFVSLTKENISFKKEGEIQTLSGVNWDNISICLFDEQDLPLIGETRDLITKLYKDEAYEKLKPSDWKVIKQQETSEYSEIEYEVITVQRQALRDMCQEKINRLNACLDLTNYKIELYQ